MIERLIVALDGTDASWRAAEVAAHLARRAGCVLSLVHVVEDADDIAGAERRLGAELAARSLGPIRPPLVIDVATPTVAAALARRATAESGSLMVMASHGRGRVGALLGSVATAVLDATGGPVVMVGPQVDPDRVDHGHELVAPVDGSQWSESALPFGATLVGVFGLRPWVVSVIEPDVKVGSDVVESAHPTRLAHALARETGHEAEFETLHDHHPGEAVARFADDVGAAMIVASSHGRTGMDRLAHGSIAAAMVRSAPCPVVLVHPVDPEPSAIEPVTALAQR